MGTVTVSTTPVQLDDGSHAAISIGNTGAPGSPAVTVTIGSRTERFEAGFSRRLDTGGLAVSAVTAFGSTTLAVDVTGVAPSPGGDAGAFADRVLSNLTDTAAARTGLGLGGAATRSVGTGSGTVAAGDDSRITGAAQKSANLSDVASVATARGNLGAAPTASPTFTGTVTIPNASVDTAAMAFGQAAQYPNSSGRATVVPRVGSLDVRDYIPAGTPLDGSVDVGPYIRAAVAASTGKALYFGPGTYLFNAATTTMQVPAGARIWADPGTVTILFGTDSAGQYREFARNNGDEVTIENITIRRNADFPAVMFPVQARTGFTLRRVTLDGQRDTYATNYCHGLQLGVNNGGTADDICLTRSTFTKLSYGLFQANASTATTKNIRVKNCRFTNNYATDLEFNNPNGTMSGVRVIDCVFSANQTAITGAGFAVGLAFVSDAKIRGNTISGYNNEAIHVEDYSDDVTIDNNTISTCGVLYTGVIQVISGSSRIRIMKNRITTAGNATSIGTINLLAGGSGSTPGGRSVIAPRFVTVHGNEITTGGTTKGLYAESVLYLTVADNRFDGPGNVSSGAYAGPFCYAIQIYTGTNTIISGNWISGFTYGLYPQNSTILAFGDGSVVSGNIFRRCLLGMAMVNAAAVTVTGNTFHICQSPLILSQGSATTDNVAVTGNQAVGCTNPMAIHGVLAVTTTGTATIGAGRTLTVANLKNTLPIGTVVVLSGGGTLTTTAVATFDSTSIVGTVATANVAAAETGVAYLPYSSNAAKNRTIANNGDDYYGAAGHGVKIASVAADYRILGFEGLVLATAGGITITLPPAANHRGMAYAVKNAAGSSLTVAAQAGNVDGSATATVAAAAAVRAVSDGANWWLAA